MSVTIPTYSRLRFDNLLTIDGITFWDALDLPTIVSQSDDLKHTVITSDRIDLLANQFYGYPSLWWVIAEANDIELIPTQLNVGQVLTIPSPRYVLQELFKRALNG